ncbi:hypothetical protein LXL04_000907 [Taraxacum kok-saghyz]
MGCFLGCFGSSKDQKRKRQRYKVIVGDQKPKIQNLLKADAALRQNIIETPSNSDPKPREKTEEPLSLKRRKKVTFDTTVTTYEHIEVYDSTESLLQKNEKGDSEIKANNIPNYRYGNCVESDDEFEDLDSDDDGDDEVIDDDDDKLSMWDSIDSDINTDNKNGYAFSVLNPVENITQWQALKSRGRAEKVLSFKGQKENLSLNKETLVDSSLSNWLITSEINARNKKPIC